MSRRPIVVPALGLAVGSLLGLTACSAPDQASADAAEEAETESVDTELVPAIRQDVVEMATLEASVGNGTVLTLPIEIEGTVTWAPAQGAMLRSGDVVVEVGERPVVLVIGESPLYRPLRLVVRGERDEAGTRIGALKGADVAQLQQYLLDEGFDDKGRLIVDETFGLSTQRAVKSWQTSVGHPATGVIDTSQMLFMTSEVLVSSELSVGQRFEQFDVSGTNTVLSVNGSTADRDFFPVGETIEVLSEPPTTGVVTRSSRITTEDGTRQFIEIIVDGVRPDDLGQSVQISGSLTRAEDALTVPVRALLAVSEGGWVVEVASGSGTKRVEVELIEVVGTTAIVSGIEEGDEVVIPL